MGCYGSADTALSTNLNFPSSWIVFYLCFKWFRVRLLVRRHYWCAWLDLTKYRGTSSVNIVQIFWRKHNLQVFPVPAHALCHNVFIRVWPQPHLASKQPRTLIWSVVPAAQPWIYCKMAYQITSLTIVYSTVYLSADLRKHQSSAPLAFVRGIQRGPVNSPHKGPVTRKMFPFIYNIYTDLQPMQETVYWRNGKAVYRKMERTSLWHQGEATIPRCTSFQRIWQSPGSHVPCQNLELNQRPRKPRDRETQI